MRLDRCVYIRIRKGDEARRDDGGCWVSLSGKKLRGKQRVGLNESSLRGIIPGKSRVNVDFTGRLCALEETRETRSFRHARSTVASRALLAYLANAVL